MLWLGHKVVIVTSVAKKRQWMQSHWWPISIRLRLINVLLMFKKKLMIEAIA